MSKLNLANWCAPEDVNPSNINSGKIDSRGANWSKQILGSLDLKGANLCRVDLRGTDLSKCELEGADLRLARYDSNTLVPENFDLYKSGAIGPYAKLNGVFLNNADLRRMDLRGAILMGAYLSGANLSQAILDEVTLAGADLRNSILIGALCRGTRFGTSELDMADLRGADLHNAVIENVQSIRGADFSLSKGLENQANSLLNRPSSELDQWNPITRNTTRASIESLIQNIES
tara:strand:- start:610 stop:1308 length:699 start_codon:yes stop_codon:yes gene_type:complete